MFKKFFKLFKIGNKSSMKGRVNKPTNISPAPSSHVYGDVQFVETKEQTISHQIAMKVLADLEKYHPQEWIRNAWICNHPNLDYSFFTHHALNYACPVVKDSVFIYNVDDNVINLKDGQLLYRTWHNKLLTREAELREQEKNALMKTFGLE